MYKDKLCIKFKILGFRYNFLNPYNLNDTTKVLSMIYENVELHNIEDLVSVDGFSGLRMQRIPESVRRKLNPVAQYRMCLPVCAEIRFVSDHPVSIELECPKGTGSVEVFYGTFQSTEKS